MNKDELKEKIGRYKATFGSETGIHVLEDLKKMCHYEKSVFSGTEKIDPYKLAYVEGMRNAILYILSYVNRQNIE